MEKSTEEQPKQTSPPFSYEGENGPEHWGILDPSFELCGIGENQSPINLTGAKERDLSKVVFNYQSSKSTIINNGYSVQVNCEPGSFIEVGREAYELEQFHFHAPSEHQVDGKYFPIEMHLVHKNEADGLAVIGVFLDAGQENSAFNLLWEILPTEEGAETEVDIEINAQDLMPASKITYRYEGSLTTPPCTEGVRWLVMATPVELSEEQICTFEQIYSGNNRPVQPLNGRSLLLDSTP